MRYPDFFKCLQDRPRGPRVEVPVLADIVNSHHNGVGRVRFKYFPDFEDAQFGMFIWLEEERTSAYEDPFNDAVIGSYILDKATPRNR